MSTARYLLRMFVFVAVGLVLLGFLQELSRKYPESESHAERLERIEAAYEDAGSIEILALGNSHAGRSFEPTLLPRKGHVLGLAWNDVFEVEHQARVLTPDMPNLSVLILVLSYTSFHWDNALSDNPGLLNSRRMFYAERLTTPWKPGDVRNYLQAKTFWIVRSDHWYGVIAGLRGEERRPSSRDVRRSRSYLERHAEERAEMFLRRSRMMTELQPDLPDRAYAATSDLIARMRQSGVRVILVTPPYHTSFLARVHLTELPEEYRLLTGRLAAEHDVEWLDASRLFATSDAMFFDSDHLNHAGREAFTRWIAQRLAGP